MVDGTAAAGALTLAVSLRFEFAVPAETWASLAWFAPLAAVVHVCAGSTMGLYAGRWRFGGFEEVAGLARAIIITTAIVAAANRFVFDLVLPTSSTLVFGAIALLASAGVRWYWRLVIERKMRPGGEARRVLVFGAGEAGYQLLSSMLRSPSSPLAPVALLDDDRHAQRLRLMGIPVVGTREDLIEASQRYNADALIIAIPSASRLVIQDLSRRAAEADLEVMVLPPVADLLGGMVDISDVRPLTEADLLGRRVIDTDIESIAGYVTGRRVLVTGAGGSIGSELCRQITRYSPDELVMLERDESALHAVQLSIEGRALLDSRNLVVCDIRDRERLDDVFAEHRPEVIFHAAALKHLPLLEMHPGEAYKTNCIGTQNLLEVALRHDVARFVNISTDKAADPSSVLGMTKRIAERLTSSAARRSDGIYLSVRFGNVLGSRGSVLTAFRAQIAAGGPVTVTDPDVTRYFMTVEEAVQLVIQAGAVGDDGEALVLDMGEPVRIADVARRLVEQADEPVKIVYTGLRPGEKLHEVLIGTDEQGARPAHPLISHVEVPPLNPALLRRVDGSDKRALMRLTLAAPVGQPSGELISRID